MNSNLPYKILKAGLTVGTFDILAAVLYYYLMTGKGPVPIFKFIASGVFGLKAYFPENDLMIFYGLLFHYLIAFIFTAFFFWICSKFPNVLKFKLVTGTLYGVFIWMVMNLIVQPLSNTPKGPFNLSSAIIGMIILIICIGMPLSLIADQHFSVNKSKITSL